MESSYSILCNKVISGGISHLERHEKTVGQNKCKAAKKIPKIESYIKKTDGKHSKLVKEAELKLTMFLHEHNLPF